MDRLRELEFDSWEQYLTWAFHFSIWSTHVP